MTNPTRTRAEIQAEIEKLQAELDVAWPQKGDIVYLEATVNQVYDDTDGIVDVRIVGDGDVYPAYAQALIPAADLIPRAEHERALLAANTRTDKVVLHLNAADAVAYLVDEYDKDWGDTPEAKARVYHDGENGGYRVTVERVVAKNATTDNDHIVDANNTIEPADAEPVGALIRELNRHWDQIAQTKGGEWTNSHRAITDILEKINRHPAPPVATAVAPKGVVARLLALGDCLKDAEKPWMSSITRAIANEITELPEPSEWARAIVNEKQFIALEGLSRQQMLDRAAALIERAALLAKEAE